jgi:hypothetical protein
VALIDYTNYSSDYKYEDMKDRKQNIVVYSGGCDSTLLKID